jgi:hypothetical protein
MLRLLLDEQISTAVAGGLRKKNPKLWVRSLAEWEEGRYLAEPDWMLLHDTAKDRLTLVTYDRATLPPILKSWGEEGRNHGGVIFVDQKTIPSSDFGSLIRALLKLHEEALGWDWQDRIVILRR